MNDNVEPIKLTLFERSILECALEKGFEYIVRDLLADALYIYKEKPRKCTIFWVSTGLRENIGLFNRKFQFIKASDIEPRHIPTLLENCEVIEND